MPSRLLFKKSLSLIWVFFLFDTLSVAQDRSIDSLVNQLIIADSDNHRLALYKDLLPMIYPNNADLIVKFYPDAIQHAASLDSLDKAAKWSIELFQYYQLTADGGKQALETMKKATEFVPGISSSVMRGNVYLKYAAAYYDLGQFEEAVEEYTNAINQFAEEDSIFVADALFFRGQAKDFKGEFINAVNDYQLAALYYELLGDEEYVDHVQNSMSIIFSKYGMLEESEKIRLKLLENHLKRNQKEYWAIVMYNRAGTYRKAGYPEENLRILKEVYENLNAVDDPHLEVALNLSLANHYAGDKDKPKFEFHFQRADSIFDSRIGEGSYLDISFLRSRFLGEKNFGDLSRARIYLDEYKEQANAEDKFSDKLDVLEFEADLLKMMGNYPEAFQALSSWTQKKDSVFTVNKATSFAYYQTLYETEKKERELVNKSLEIENITLVNQKRLAWMIGISLLIIGGLVFLYLYKNLQSQIKAKEMQEKFSRDLLVYQEEERKRISKDLHDGLGQSLLLIKNKVAMSADPSATGMLNSAIEELRGISRSLHPFQLEELGLTQALKNTLEHLDGETEIFISSEIDDVDHLFDKNEQLQVFRMVQEVFNNIIKHAQASAVRVLVVLEKNMVSLSIEDNGVGFDFSEKYQDFGSLGLKTLKERTASLNGTMKVESEKGKGTKFSFYLYK
ncbi:sensor histidine kinase [Indibacter alkaliphilus LW1]|uniref:histidine kinase n=1 Tax=Indibacter alkaliphilus (strain CCUG 57479 / KCTC 22604 / LW1) TaxID=1189612 RepID=S2DM88_INDAL|nr:sensor histidine kinase [Indibacter alkaliphilus]EPA00063.1 sensor histidine kinase [Indibacter alkaliphilus LW1]